MKTFLRDLNTGLLYRAPAGWVESWLEATDFGYPDAAEAAALELGNGDFEVSVAHADGKPVWGRKIQRGLKSDSL
jgi:hypothetical protein